MDEQDVALRTITRRNADTLACVLVRHGIVDSRAVHDSEGYDGGGTLLRIQAAARELSTLQFCAPPTGPACAASLVGSDACASGPAARTDGGRREPAGSACERIVIQSRKIIGNVWSDYCAGEERTLEDASEECAHLNSWAKNTEWRVIARSDRVVWPNVPSSPTAAGGSGGAERKA